MPHIYYWRTLYLWRNLENKNKRKNTLYSVIDYCRIDVQIQFFPSSHFISSPSRYPTMLNANTMPHQRSTITTKKPEEGEHDE